MTVNNDINFFTTLPEELHLEVFKRIPFEHKTLHLRSVCKVFDKCILDLFLAEPSSFPETHFSFPILFQNVYTTNSESFVVPTSKLFRKYKAFLPERYKDKNIQQIDFDFLAIGTDHSNEESIRSTGLIIAKTALQNLVIVLLENVDNSVVVREQAEQNSFLDYYQIPRNLANTIAFTGWAVSSLPPPSPDLIEAVKETNNFLLDHQVLPSTIKAFHLKLKDLHGRIQSAVFPGLAIPRNLLKSTIYEIENRMDQGEFSGKIVLICKNSLTQHVATPRLFVDTMGNFKIQVSSYYVMEMSESHHCDIFTFRLATELLPGKNTVYMHYSEKEPSVDSDSEGSEDSED